MVSCKLQLNKEEDKQNMALFYKSKVCTLEIQFLQINPKYMKIIRIQQVRSHDFLDSGLPPNLNSRRTLYPCPQDKSEEKREETREKRRREKREKKEKRDERRKNKQKLFRIRKLKIEHTHNKYGHMTFS